MTLHVYMDLEQRSDEWYEARCGIVTASVVGQLITPAKKQVANNDDSRSIARAIVAERITGFVDPTWQSLDMWRGATEEPDALIVYSEHYAAVKPCGFMVRDDWGFQIGYSPDALAGDDGAVEVKCPRAKEHLRVILADEVPAEHMAQLQTGLLVSGRQWIDYVSHFGGMPLWRKRVTPDTEWHKAIVSAVATFEGHAKQMVAKYRAAVRGLPMTERRELTELEKVI
jgi:hypothetical protein